MGDLQIHFDLFSPAEKMPYDAHFSVGSSPGQNHSRDYAITNLYRAGVVRLPAGSSEIIEVNALLAVLTSPGW
jgi:hypothetical protein